MHAQLDALIAVTEIAHPDVRARALEIVVVTVLQYALLVALLHVVLRAEVVVLMDAVQHVLENVSQRVLPDVVPHVRRLVI